MQSLGMEAALSDRPRALIVHGSSASKSQFGPSGQFLSSSFMLEPKRINRCALTFKMVSHLETGSTVQFLRVHHPFLENRFYRCVANLSAQFPRLSGATSMIFSVCLGLCRWEFSARNCQRSPAAKYLFPRWVKGWPGDRFDWLWETRFELKRSENSALFRPVGGKLGQPGEAKAAWQRPSIAALIMSGATKADRVNLTVRSLQPSL